MFDIHPFRYGLEEIIPRLIGTGDRKFKLLKYRPEWVSNNPIKEAVKNTTDYQQEQGNTDAQFTLGTRSWRVHLKGNQQAKNMKGSIQAGGWY